MSKWIKVAVSCLAALCIAPTVFAQSYPTRPVKIVIPFGPGSATDIVARLLADELRVALAQPFIVDNKPGASAQIAAEQVAKSAPDGYTLLLTTNTSHSANPYLFKKLPYDPVRDFTPLARVCYFAFVLAVDARLPIQSVRELIAYAKANPISYGFGNSTGQVAGAALNNLAGLNATAIPYKSTPQALTDVVGGQVAFMFVDLASSQPFSKSGRLRSIAVSTESRSALAPELPTLKEAAGIEGFDLSAWVGLFGPAGIRPEVVARISDEMQKILAKPDVRARLEGLGADVAPGTSSELGALVTRQLDIWGRKVRDAGIQPE